MFVVLSDPAIHDFEILMRGTPCSLLFALLFVASGGSLAQPARLAAPNVVEISPRLVTSGQPSAEALAGLKAQGFEAVIYLAPPTVTDAVRDEQLSSASTRWRLSLTDGAAARPGPVLGVDARPEPLRAWSEFRKRDIVDRDRRNSRLLH